MNKLLIIFFIPFIIISQNNRGYIVSVEDEAPHFNINLDGEEFFDLSNETGKVIMLQFTASWCSVCIKEMPYIEEEIWQKHKNNEEFILIGLAKDTEKRNQRDKEIELLIKQTGVTYPIISDYNSKIFNLFADEKAGVTRNIIIDQNGKIAFLTRLFEKEEFNDMKNIINKLLEKKY
ncbi:MAG: redoxin [Flavobacteriales bacterium]|jgi:peroxiredoxin|nr:redoxin [Flavobacteriales bacterium]|tara:strand:- start:26724 stop:27254 length:531 start_codon:yes stop_codon:yes gene_type:complete